jgi:hypothetical protein
MREGTKIVAILEALAYHLRMLDVYTLAIKFCINIIYKSESGNSIRVRRA